MSVDESPIPTLAPQEEAELLYKLDVSKDALPGKNYQLKILFQFSDSRRDDLTDWVNAYVRIEEEGQGMGAGRSALFRPAGCGADNIPPQKKEGLRFMAVEKARACLPAARPRASGS